jgi:hypothetical protein
MAGRRGATAPSFTFSTVMLRRRALLAHSPVFKPDDLLGRNDPHETCGSKKRAGRINPFGGGGLQPGG